MQLIDQIKKGIRVSQSYTFRASRSNLMQFSLHTMEQWVRSMRHTSWDAP